MIYVCYKSSFDYVLSSGPFAQAFLGPIFVVHRFASPNHACKPGVSSVQFGKFQRDITGAIETKTKTAPLMFIRCVYIHFVTFR